MGFMFRHHHTLLHRLHRHHHRHIDRAYSLRSYQQQAVESVLRDFHCVIRHNSR